MRRDKILNFAGWQRLTKNSGNQDLNTLASFRTFAPFKKRSHVKY